MVLLVLQALLDHLVLLVIEECLVFQVQQVLLVEEDQLDPREKEVLLVHQAKRGLQDHLGHKVLQVQLVPEVKGERRDLLVKMDHLELEDLVTRVPLELLDLLVHLALQVYQDHLVKVDLLETLEKGVKEVQMGHQD